MTARDTLAAAMREALSKRNASVRSVALAAGLPVRSVQSVLDGHVPSVNRAKEICNALGLEFYVGPARDRDPSREPAPGVEPPPPAASTLPDLSVFSPEVEMSVRGWAKCSLVGYLEDEKEFIDHPAPVHLPDEHAFYAMALGPSMVPEGIDNGDYCLVSPAAPLQAGWRVWLKNRQQQVTIKRLVTVTETSYHLRGWQGPDRRRQQAPYHDEWRRSNVAEAGVVLAVYRGAPSRTHPPELIPDPKPPQAEAAVKEPARPVVPRDGSDMTRVLEEMTREQRALREEVSALRELVARLAPAETDEKSARRPATPPPKKP